MIKCLFIILIYLFISYLLEIIITRKISKIEDIDNMGSFKLILYGTLMILIFPYIEVRCTLKLLYYIFIERT